MADKVEEIEDRGDNFTPPDEDGGIVLTGENDPDLLDAIAGDVDADIDGDVDADVGETDKPAPDDEPHLIPKSRFDEVNNKAKSAAEENARLKAELDALKAARPAKADEPEVKGVESDTELRTELKALRAQAREALLDGDLDLSDDLSDQIDALNRKMAKEEWTKEQDTRSQQQQEEAAVNAVAAEAFKLYPFLDNSQPEHDKDAIAVIFNRRVALQAEGKGFAEALRQAVDEKAPRFAKLHGDAEATPGDKVRQQREEAARRKAAGASGQPPHVAGSEKETFKVDVNKLTDAEYDKLPESVKKQARGDNL